MYGDRQIAKELPLQYLRVLKFYFPLHSCHKSEICRADISMHKYVEHHVGLSGVQNQENQSLNISQATTVCFKKGNPRETLNNFVFDKML